MANLTLKAVRKTLGQNPILHGIDLDVRTGELVVLVGPSGCGKSTLLRTIAGLESPDSGTISIADKNVTALPPRERDLAMVFQSYALYPHLTVRENLAFGLKLRGSAESLINERIDSVSAMLGLGTLLARFPRELSGGQRQRVAMGRAIARQPQIFLFDEPLSNLDAALRAEVRVEIKRLHEALHATMIYVTHDQVEAMTLADRMVVMRAGRVEQIGPPLEIYASPRNEFVAGFLGTPKMNFLNVNVVSHAAHADGITLPTPSPLADGTWKLGVRPEHFILSRNSGQFRFTVEVTEYLGFEAHVHGTIGNAPATLRLESGDARKISRGDILELDALPEHLHFFDPKNGEAAR